MVKHSLYPRFLIYERTSCTLRWPTQLVGIGLATLGNECCCVVGRRWNNDRLVIHQRHLRSGKLPNYSKQQKRRSKKELIRHTISAQAFEAQTRIADRRALRRHTTNCRSST